MSFIRIAAALVACFLFHLSSAQTSTVCNPLKEKCASEKGLAASSYAVDFTKSESTPENWIVANYETVSYGPNGAEFTFNKRHDAPSMWADFKFWFGRVEVVVQGAPGLGIISSMVLLSDDLDEIDWEMKGTGGNAIGTNYWGKGIMDYTKNVYVGVPTPNCAFHTYTLDWSPSSLVWEIDGVVVRNVTAAAAGNQYPQSPMKLCFGVWDGSDPSNAAGTIQWAGGKTPLLPPKSYSMYVKSAMITNTNPAAAYENTNMSGNASSIKVLNDSLAVHSTSRSASTTSHSTSKILSVASNLSIKAEGSKTTPSMGKTSPSHLDSTSTHLTNSSVASATIKTATSSITSTSARDSSILYSTTSKTLTAGETNPIIEIIHTTLTTCSQISVIMTNGKTSQKVVSVISTIYSTSTSNVCPKCSSRATTSASVSISSHASKGHQSGSHSVISSLSTHQALPSSHSSNPFTIATFTAAPPMAPVLLSAVTAAAKTSKFAASTPKTTANSKTTPGPSTKTSRLTSTTTRYHSLVLWSTNGTSVVVVSTDNTAPTSSMTNSVAPTSGTDSPASTPSGIIFTGSASVMQYRSSWPMYTVAILAALSAHLYL